MDFFKFKSFVSSTLITVVFFLGLGLALEEFRLPEDIATGLGDLYGAAPPDTAAE